MIRTVVFSLTAAGMVLPAAAALAEELPPPTPTSPPGSCEAHLWAATYLPRPGAAPKSSALVRTEAPSGNPLAISSVLDARARLADVDDDEVRRALGLPADTRIVRHPDWIDRQAAKDEKVRLAPLPRDDCYADVVLSEMIYWPGRTQANGRDAVQGKLSYRRFGPGGRLVASFRSTVGADLDKRVDDASIPSIERIWAIRGLAPKLFASFGERRTRKQAGSRGR